LPLTGDFCHFGGQVRSVSLPLTGDFCHFGGQVRSVDFVNGGGMISCSDFCYQAWI
jgi:hypothetical protein